MARAMPRELREQMANLVREKPHATQGQIVKIFKARTGYTVSYQTARYARRKWSGAPNWGYHLSPEQRQSIKDLIELAKPLYCWEEIARDFEAMTGRRTSARTVANIAYDEMGIRPIGQSVASGGGIRDRNMSREIDRASSAKLADAPYRPGYFSKSYRGPDGGPSGDSARVYRTGGTNAEATR